MLASAELLCNEIFVCRGMSICIHTEVK